MKKITFVLVLGLILGTFFGCASNKGIGEDLSHAQLIQLGQTAFEKGDYKSALRYYNADIDRYGSMTDCYVEAKYEIGHAYLRNRNYEEAYKALTEVLNIYENSFVGMLPPEYKKLSEICIKQIPEKKLAELQK